MTKPRDFGPLCGLLIVLLVGGGFRLLGVL